MFIQKLVRPGGILTHLIFFGITTILLLSLIPAVFPALLAKITTSFEDTLGVDQFELGLLAFPILFTNAIVLILLIAHHKNKLPKTITNLFKQVFDFEISKKVAAIVLIIIIASYISVSIMELFNNQFDSDYYGIFKPWLEEFDVLRLPDNQLNRDFGHHVQLFFEVISMKIFANYKVIPFIASIVLLVLIYFFTSEISKKRFAGIISVLITAQSNIFLFYDTSVSYTNLWVLFYLLGLYAVHKAWQMSGIAYVLAILSKVLTILFMPASFLFAYRVQNTTRKKIIISYTIIAVIGVSFLTITGADLNPVNTKSFDGTGFVGGFTAFAFSFSDDVVITSFLLPVIFGLFVMSKKGNPHADSIMLIILTMLVSAPFLTAFSDNQNVPYRFVPVVVFFAIGVGITLSKRS